MTTRPTAFISYSWEDPAHKLWAATLATQLRTDGVDVHLDQWHSVPGDQLPRFMEREIRENQYVIVVCTPKYKSKSDERKGGVGYEGDIMTAEVFTKNNHSKFIPVLAKGTWDESAPSWLAGKYYVDFSDPTKLAQNYKDLLNTIVGKRSKAPPLGKAPIGFKPPTRSQAAQKSMPEPEPIKILGVVVNEVTEPRMDGTRGCALYTVPFRLSRTPSGDWVELFLRAWQFPRQFTTMHRPGIASVYGDRILLEGTTIHEVQKYHKETLKLCIEEANKKETELRAGIAKEQALAEEQSKTHRKAVEEIASQMQFDDSDTESNIE